MEIKRLLSIPEKIQLARYLYKIGYDYISDQEFDGLLAMLSEDHPLRFQKWEDVKYEDIEHLLQYENISPKDLEESKQKMIATREGLGNNVQDIMLRFPAPMSMQMTTDYENVYNKYLPQIIAIANQNNTTIDLFQSFKLDGWCITCYYDTNGDGLPFLAHTRGRTTSDVTVCTELMRLITPNIKEILSPTGSKQFGVNNIIRVTGELVLRRDVIQILRNNYPNKKFSNVRNSVSAFVHGSIDIEKYKDYVSFYAYSVYDLNHCACPFNRVSEMYSWLNNSKFLIPPCFTISIPRVENLNQVVRQYLDAYYNSMEVYYKDTFSKYYECDGIVLQPDIISWNDQIQQIAQGSFGDGLLAIKARYWAEKVYKAKVKEIVYPKSRASRSVMAIIEPLPTVLGQVVQRVPLINLQRAVIENDVRIGDTIEFIYHSNQLPMFTRNISHIERIGGSVDD